MVAALTVERDGPIARLRIEPSAKLDRAFAIELEGACASINDEADVRVAVLSLPGGAPAYPDEHLGPAEQRRFLEEHPPFACLEAMGQPVICAISGEAIGAGLELALACDIRIAAEGARFGFEGFPAAGGTQRLPRLIGRGEALRLLLLDETIDAAEALRIGLVSAVHPPDKLLAEADALARRMASRGPIALRYAKEAVRRGLELPLDQALRYETDLTVILQTTEDRAEGVRAFREKREPEFKGR